MTEIEKLWRDKGDGEVSRAMERIEEYRPTAQSVIRAEHQRRGLPPPRSEDEDESEVEVVPHEGDAAVEILPGESEPKEEIDPIVCARCEENLEFVGSKRFHEGTNWGIFGELGELFVKRERFDVYVCPRCGKVELFVDGIGEDMRPQ